MRAKIIRRHVNNQNSNPYIPHELFATEILPRLPDVKTLLRFKSVSKQWYNTISSNKFGILLNDECFNQNHSFLLLQSNNDDNKLFLFDYDDHGNSKSSAVRPPEYASNSNTEIPKRPIQLVSSSGGLVCLISAHNALYFWNPTTRACREILFPVDYVYLQSPPNSYPLWAFGYLPSIDDYKFLYVENSWKTAYAYTLRTGDDAWREIDVTDVVDSYKNNSVSTGVLLLNGKTHWLIAKELEDGYYYFRILVYDFIDERFSEIALPELYTSPYSCTKKCFGELYNTCIGDVEHELCLFHRDCEREESWYLDVWVMKEYGKIESWSKMYKVETRCEVKWIFDCSNSFKFREQGKVYNLTLEFLYWGDDDDDEYIAGYVDDGTNDQKLSLYVGVANNTSDDECFDINHVQRYVPSLASPFPSL